MNRWNITQRRKGNIVPVYVGKVDATDADHAVREAAFKFGLERKLLTAHPDEPVSYYRIREDVTPYGGKVLVSTGKPYEDRIWGHVMIDQTRTSAVKSYDPEDLILVLEIGKAG